MPRLRSVVLALALAAAFPVAANVQPAAAADATTAANTNTALALINESRRAQGLCPVALDPALTEVATNWSAFLAARGILAHNTTLLEFGIAAGENVGYGADVAQVHNMFSNDRPHLLNMIDARSTLVGVGFATAGGRTYVTYDFRSADGLQHRC